MRRLILIAALTSSTTVGRVYDERGRLGDEAWQRRRHELYATRNCAFVGAAPAPQ